tara:strand:- start:5203 stop:5565 length:363 start_codon:yes stop_codon:yes gene_type:complete
MKDEKKLNKTQMAYIRHLILQFFMEEEIKDNFNPDPETHKKNMAICIYTDKLINYINKENEHKQKITNILKEYTEENEGVQGETSVNLPEVNILKEYIEDNEGRFPKNYSTWGINENLLN